MTRFWIFLFLTAFIFPSKASASDVFISEICNVINIVSGPAGKAFAAFAIVSVGIGFFSGKVSWGLLIGVSVAIATMFGAPSIVSAITGKPSFQCATTTYYGACVDGACPCPIGFTGNTCSTCSLGYTGAGCNICDSGYSLENGTCKRLCDIRSVPGVNQISVRHGTTTTACNATNYSGSINYTCDNGSFNLASGSSCSCIGNRAGTNFTSCATGYTGTSCENCFTGYTQHNGSCQQDCPVIGQSGINDTTEIPVSGAKECEFPAVGSVDYECSGGDFSITGGSCNLNPTKNYEGRYRAPQTNSLTMNASAGKTWAGVHFASYGTPSNCVIDETCHDPNSARVVHDACFGKPTCTIMANNQTFNNDCEGKPKRLQVILYYY
jgi:type IV secretory pathway VirB2 component (pilin)